MFVTSFAIVFCCKPLFLSPFAHVSSNPFTYLEIPFLCCGANTRPLLTLVGGILNPPFPLPILPSPPPERSPLVHVTCPSKTPLQYWLCTV